MHSITITVVASTDPAGKFHHEDVDLLLQEYSQNHFLQLATFGFLIVIILLLAKVYYRFVEGVT